MNRIAKEQGNLSAPIMYKTEYFKFKVKNGEKPANLNDPKFREKLK